MISSIAKILKKRTFSQVFGVAPPQTLYQTRPAATTPIDAPPLPPLPDSIRGKGHTTDYFSNPVPSLPFMKTKKKKNSRPGTSESSKKLLGGRSSMEEEQAWQQSNTLQRTGSLLYSQYQASLNSLNDIIDRVSCLHLLFNSPEIGFLILSLLARTTSNHSLTFTSTLLMILTQWITSLISHIRLLPHLLCPR